MRGAAEGGENLKGEVGLKLAGGRELHGQGGHLCKGNCGRRLMHLDYAASPTGTGLLVCFFKLCNICLLSKFPNWGKVFPTKLVPGKSCHHSR